MTGIYKTGTITLNSNSNIVTGTGTLFQSVANARLGDLFSLDGKEFYEIYQVDDETQLRIRNLVTGAKYLGSSVTGANYAIVRNFAASADAQIAADVVSLQQRWHEREREMTEWFASDANYHQITDIRGDKVLVITPTGLNNLVDGPVNIEDFGFPSARESQALDLNDFPAGIFYTRALSIAHQPPGFGSGIKLIITNKSDTLFYQKAIELDTSKVRFRIATTAANAEVWNTLGSEEGGGTGLTEVSWNDIQNIPLTAERWPSFNEVTGKPEYYPPTSHFHEWNEVTGKPSNYPPSAHDHLWSEINSKPDTATRWPLSAEISDLPKNLGSKLQTATTVTLQSGTLTNGKTLSLEQGEEAYIETVGYDNVFDGGSALYRCTTLSDERTRISDQAWIPNDIDSFYLLGGTEYVAVLVPNGQLLLEQFGIFPTTDASSNVARFYQILSYELPVRTAQGGVDIPMDDMVYLQHGPNIDLDLGEVTLLSVGAPERIFIFRSPYKTTYNITDISYDDGRTLITLATTPTDIVRGGPLKVVADDIINPYADKPNERIGEHLVVQEVNGNVVTCQGILTFNYVTNPRCAQADHTRKMSLKNINVRRDIAHTNGVFAVAIEVNGYVKAHFENIYSRLFTGTLLKCNSCYRYYANKLHADELLDDSENQALGYVFQDGSQEGEVHALSGGYVRHVYTTGSDDVPAGSDRIYQYGGQLNSTIFSFSAENGNNYSLDTHEDSYGLTVISAIINDAHSYTTSSTGAFQDRGQKTHVKFLSYTTGQANISTVGKGILFNKGSNNTHIETFVYQDRFGRGIATFKAAENLSPSYRIDHVIVKSLKTFANVLQVEEPVNLRIGKIDLYLLDPTLSYHANWRTMTIGGNVNLRIDEINYHLDDHAIPDLTGSSGIVFGISSDVKTLKAKLNFYCTENTWKMSPQQTDMIRGVTTASAELWASSTAYAVDEIWRVTGSFSLYYKVINAYTSDASDINVDIASGNVELIQLPVIDNASIDVTVFFDNYTNDIQNGLMARDIDESNSTVTWKYRIIDTGREVASSRYRHDNVYEPNMMLELGSDMYGLRESLGRKSDHSFVSFYESHSESSTISFIDPPLYEGQTLEFYLSSYNDVAFPAQDVVISANATNLRLAADKTVNPGEKLHFIATNLGGELKWELFN